MLLSALSKSQVDRSAVAVGRSAFGRIWVVEKVDEIDPRWRRAAFDQHCKDFRYYELLERTLGGQFECRYFVLENEAAGEVALQPFFFVDQDLVAGLPARLRRWVAALRKARPRLLRMRILMVGCCAGEGHLDIVEPWAVRALHDALDTYAGEASLILLKDFPSHYRPLLGAFSGNGYCRVPSMPAARLELNFESFEHYMQTRLSKVFRKNLRRKLRAHEHAAPLTMEVVADASAFAAEIHGLYRQTQERSALKFEELTEEYFRSIGKELPERVRFFLWRQNGRLIAFNLCMIHGDTLYDCEVGLDYPVALELHLYFVTWRDVIEWCLKNRLKTYHTGPLNYDPKLHLRLELAPLDLYARHVSGWINPLFKLALRFLQPARHDPVLARFPNAHELHR